MAACTLKAHRVTHRFLIGAIVMLLIVANPATRSIAADPSPTPEVRVPAGPAVDDGSSGANVRSRTDRKGSESIPNPPESPTVAADSVPRLDDPVLRWLPEIMTASKKWGVPPEILAGIIRIESQGEPGPISPAG